MRGPLDRSELLAQGLKRCRVGIIATDIAQQSRKLAKGSGIDTSAVLLEALAGASLQLIKIPTGPGHTDDRHIEVPTLQHRLQRRENLLVGEVAGGAEEDKRIGTRFAHRDVAFSTVICRRVFRDGRQTRSALPKAACSGSPPRHVSRIARRAP